MMRPTGEYWTELKAMAADASLELISLETNLGTLEPANHFFMRYLQAAVMIAPIHCLTGTCQQL